MIPLTVKTRSKWRQSLAITMVICLIPITASAVELAAGYIVEIVDVDLLRVQTTVGTEETVRIIGLDNSWRGIVPVEEEEFRDVVFRRQMRFLNNQILLLKLDLALGDIRHQDEQGHVFVHAYLADGRNYAELLIRNGYARPDFSIPFDPQTMQRYKEAELAAEENMRGLWSNQWPPQTPLGKTKKLKKKSMLNDQKVAYVFMDFAFAFLEVVIRDAIFDALLP